MEDEVFAPLMVPNLSYPPPGWSHEPSAWGQQASLYHQQQQVRGRGGSGHPTRVIRRTDLRGRGGGGQRQQQHQKPPRFNTNVPTVGGTRKSWGEEWKPEEEEKKSKVDLIEKEDKDTVVSEEGEWKEVKGRRWSKTEESKKPPLRKSPDINQTRRKTPEPVVVQKRSPVSKLVGSSTLGNHEQVSPELARPGKRYSAGRKSPEHVDKKSSENHSRKSPKQSESPPLKGVPVTKPLQPCSNRKSPNLKTSPETNRRSSNSSNEGEKSMIFRNKKRSPTFEKRSRAYARASPPPRFQEKKQDCPDSDRVSSQNPSEMIHHPSLPSEQIPSVPPLVRKLSDFEVKVRDEESKLKVQKEILVFLKKNWQEVSKELKESSNEWSPRVTYYSNHILI